MAGDGRHGDARKVAATDAALRKRQRTDGGWGSTAAPMEAGREPGLSRAVAVEKGRGCGATTQEPREAAGTRLVAPGHEGWAARQSVGEIAPGTLKAFFSVVEAEDAQWTWDA